MSELVKFSPPCSLFIHGGNGGPWSIGRIMAAQDSISGWKKEVIGGGAWRSRLRSFSDIPNDDPVPVQAELIFKIALVGGEAVGKSTFVKFFAEHPLTREYVPTIGVDVTIVPNGVIACRQVYLHFYDVGSAEVGDEDNGSLQLSLADVSGVFLFFDATEQKSFAELDQWWKKMSNILYNSDRCRNPPIILLGHKADKLKEYPSCIDPKDIDRYIERIGFCAWRWTSLEKRDTITSAVRTMIEEAMMIGGGGGEFDADKGDRGSDEGAHGGSDQGANGGGDQGANEGGDQGANEGGDQGANEGDDPGANEGSGNDRVDEPVPKVNPTGTMEKLIASTSNAPYVWPGMVPYSTHRDAVNRAVFPGLIPIVKTDVLFGSGVGPSNIRNDKDMYDDQDSVRDSGHNIGHDTSGRDNVGKSCDSSPLPMSDDEEFKDKVGGQSASHSGNFCVLEVDEICERYKAILIKTQLTLEPDKIPIDENGEEIPWYLVEDSDPSDWKLLNECLVAYQDILDGDPNYDGDYTEHDCFRDKMDFIATVEMLLIDLGVDFKDDGSKAKD